MRNQVLYSIIGLAALFLVNACQKPVVNPPVLKIPTTEFTANADGGVVTVNYTLTNGVEGSKPSVDPVAEYEWVEDIAVETKAIKVTVAKNETTEPRTADFTVSYPGADNVEFTINQAAAGASSEYDYEYTVAAFMGMLYEEAETYDNYQIYTSSLPLTAEGGFDLTAVNYTFDVYAEAGTNGAFPAGEYVLGEGTAPNTIGKDNSNYTADAYETSTTFNEGTMTVSIDGENYVFDITLTDAEGKTHHLTYTGPAFETGGDEPDPSEVTFEISVDNLTYEGYTYSIVPSDKEMSYIHLGTPKAVLVQYGAMTEDGDLNEYVLHDDVVSQFLQDYRDQLVHTGDLTDATALFPASSSQDVVVLCYGIDAGDNRITPVTTYEFTMPAMPAVITLDEETIEAGAGEYNGGVYYFLGGDYDPEGTVTAVVQNGVDWVRATVDPVERYIEVSVDPNDKPVARTATITVSHPSVDEPAVLTVYQEAGELVFTANPNWTVSYSGRESDEDGTYDVTSVVSTDSERFFTAVYDVDTYNYYGIEMIAEAEVANMEYYYGPSWIQSFSYTSSVDEKWNLFSPGTYYVIAIGIDDEGNLTGLYQLSEPFEPEQLEASAAYNKWLGTWNVTGSDGVQNTIEISMQNSDASYSISNWQFGGAPALTATFNEADGSISFIGEAFGSTSTSYGNGILYLMGLAGTGETDPETGEPELLYVTTSSAIASATMTDDNNASVAGGYAVLEGYDDPLQYLGMEYAVILTDGAYSGMVLSYNPEAPHFPLTMERVQNAVTASVKSTGGLSASRGQKYVKIEKHNSTVEMHLDTASVIVAE